MNFTSSTSHLRAFANEIQIIVDQFEGRSERRDSFSDDESEVEEDFDDEEEEIWTVYETVSFRMKNRPPPVNLGLLIEFLGNFSQSIENLRLVEVNFNNSAEFYEIIGSLKNLKNLEVYKCELYNLNNAVDEISGGFKDFSSDLRTVSIFRSNKNFERVFTVFKNIENLEFLDEVWRNCDRNLIKEQKK